MEAFVGNHRQEINILILLLWQMKEGYEQMSALFFKDSR